MATQITGVIAPRRTVDAGVVPTTSNLALAEIGINHADCKIYARHPVSGDVQLIGSGRPLSGSTSGTLVASDAGRNLFITGNITVPASVFVTNDQVNIINATAGNLTITQGSGVTMYRAFNATTGDQTIPARGTASLLFASASVAYLSGV